MCIKMVQHNGLSFPCGQCRNCRINRKRDWQARLLLEAAVSKFTAFVTLTLGVDDAKDSEYCTYLDKHTAQLFLKRLRKALPPRSLRYLLVGEYGTKRGRAHYHALLFSQVPLDEVLVSKAWGLGGVHFGDVQQESIDYCLAYVLKDGTALDNVSWDDRLRRSAHPEFPLHSQGLGKGALRDLLVPDPQGGELLLPREFRVLGRSWPIGRYFRQKYRGGTVTELAEAGVSDPVAMRQNDVIELKLFQELRALSPGSVAYQQKRQEIQARREKQVKLQQGRRIRDYYRDQSRLTERRKNEAF